MYDFSMTMAFNQAMAPINAYLAGRYETNEKACLRDCSRFKLLGASADYYSGVAAQIEVIPYNEPSHIIHVSQSDIQRILTMLPPVLSERRSVLVAADAAVVQKHHEIEADFHKARQESWRNSALGRLVRGITARLG